MEMERDPCDVLGRLYMELELGNERLGQFYTPYDIAQLMAEMQQIDSVVEQVQRTASPMCMNPAAARARSWLLCRRRCSSTA